MSLVLFAIMVESDVDGVTDIGCVDTVATFMTVCEFVAVSWATSSCNVLT